MAELELGEDGDADDCHGSVLSSTITDDKERISAEHAYLVRNFGELKKV